MISPQFQHDCDACLFIGRVEGGAGVWVHGSSFGREERAIRWPAGDLYVHPYGGIVIRTGNDGWEYSSMEDAYFGALPVEWRAIARSLWRHYNKPDDFDYERMRKRRTRRRQDRRMTRRGLCPWMERMKVMPDGFPDFYEED